jgi:hypothetical protein
MYRVDHADAAAALPAMTSAGTQGYFTGGDPNTGTRATPVQAEFLNRLMMELVHAINDADGGNLALNKTDHTQLKQAIAAMIAAGTGSTVLGSYINGCLVQWNSVSSFTIGTGICRDSTNTKNIILASPLTVSLASSGANGLDTGAEGNNTFYYPFLAMKADATVCGLFSTNATTPTLPTGYLYYRRLPAFGRNNSGGDLLNIEFQGWPYQPQFFYRDMQFAGTNSDPTNVLHAGNATSWADVSLASFVPPEVTQAYMFTVLARQVSVVYNLRRKGDVSNGWTPVTRANMDTVEQFFWIDTNTSQQIQYQTSDPTATVDLTVAGGRMPLL